MELLSKNETGFWIDYKGLAKFAETGPEMTVKEILEELQMKMGFTFKHGTMAFPLSIVCQADGGEESFILHPDFIVEMPQPCRGQAQKVIEVDGIYHFTKFQQKKRRWRDSLILKYGYDIVHIDARLALLKSYRQELKRSLAKALTQELEIQTIDY